MGVAFMSFSKCRSMESPNTIVNDYDKYSYSQIILVCNYRLTAA
ncbi:hypothetical protein SAMN05421509_101165 [Chromohalobacter canadensis]|uniref:Uncharacterized protein n=1 Tax=Chromohalobacter canadensis TaxID=141389 RepID=A0A285VC52_9GAMM|nr:hypothetical protein SAMN05421509_101165 [Chromohalobacter canadensis]